MKTYSAGNVSDNSNDVPGSRSISVNMTAEPRQGAPYTMKISIWKTQKYIHCIRKILNFTLLLASVHLIPLSDWLRQSWETDL